MNIDLNHDTKKPLVKYSLMAGIMGAISLAALLECREEMILPAIFIGAMVSGAAAWVSQKAAFCIILLSALLTWSSCQKIVAHNDARKARMTEWATLKNSPSDPTPNP